MKGSMAGQLVLLLVVSFFPHQAAAYTTENYWWTAASTPPPNSGDVRLVGGSRASEGRVEIQIDGQWGSVCDDEWGYQETEVVCRQLGYEGYGPRSYSNSHYGRGSGHVWGHYMRCNGYEQCLIDCTRFDLFAHSSCSHYNEVGVDCTYEYDHYGATPSYAPTYPTYTNGLDYTRYGCSTSPQNDTVRLVGGSRSSEGRVEIYVNGEWGTVCDDNWNQNAVRVVCRQLGYNNGYDARPYSSAHFGQGSGTIWLDNFSCNGYETRLQDCTRYRYWGYNNCGHGEDAGVDCQSYLSSSTPDYYNAASTPSTTYPYWRSTAIPYWGGNTSPSYWWWYDSSPPPNTGAVRLVGGYGSHEGRVEIQVDGQWGTVCGDNFYYQAAEVVCRQLGYSGYSTYYRNAYFGRGAGPIWMDNFYCNGYESRLEECIDSRNFGRHDCSHYDDAGVRCYAGSTFDPSSTERPTTWYQTSAAAHTADYWWRYQTGPPPNTGAVRLVGGSRSYEGRVEIQVDGQWGTVCDDDFTVYAARVVCRQLGYSGYSSYFTYGGGSGPIWMDNFYCHGYESHLEDCIDFRNFGRHDCSHGEDVGVNCYAANSTDLPSTERPTTWYPISTAAHTTDYWWRYQSGPPPNTGDVRLVGGSRSSKGRVEIKVNGEWGTVCDNHWNQTTAQVVCRQLGYYDSYIVQPYYSAAFGQGYGPIWMEYYYCNGTEYRLEDCIDFRQFGRHYCQHYQDAGVDCLAGAQYTTSTTNQPYTTRTTLPSSISWGPGIQLVSSPSDVVGGVTSQLTLTCTVGERDDLSQIFLVQIDHVINGVRIPLADVTPYGPVRSHNASYRTNVHGHVPTWGDSGAYLQVVIDNPTESDSGFWECVVSALDQSQLSVREIATTTVHVTGVANLATEVGKLREELHLAEANNGDIKTAIENLQQSMGQGFAAFLITNYTAMQDRLPLQREVLDTLGGFSNSMLKAPRNGLYFLTLTVSVNAGHDVTVQLRHNGQTVLRVTSRGEGASNGQNSASLVVPLNQGDVVDVEVAQFSPGALILSSPSTFLSGYLIG